ncbi:MAG: site-2 protease family protein [Planctomycetes bacterium]|nr:site-2 protease family protein [Planctomycetota bacterium]MCB9830358.1 site-2 protease family protein [Planctomycetota bacterium]MCB9900658.1 site-2 protease family protein [Planctomycetota bacterium]
MRSRVLSSCAAVAVATPLALSFPGGSMILAILGIGFLIFIHEWGHYAACRLTGTRTETFAIGFGPRLFGWEKDRDGKRRFTVGERQLDPEDHAMDFRISAIPLGGYVKMAGEIPGEASTGAPDEFPQKTASQRAFIISAGVIMNIITAVVFYALTYGLGRPTPPPVIAMVEPGGGAWEAGLQAGDRVESIDGNTLESDIDLLMQAALATHEPAHVVYLRDGERRETNVQARHDPEHGRMRMGFSPAQISLVLGKGDGAITLGPAEKATVGGVPVVGAREALQRIQELLARGTLPVTVDIGGKQISLAPEPAAQGVEPSEPAPRFLGIEPLHPVVVGEVLDPASKVLRTGDVLVAPVGADGTARPAPGSVAGWAAAADDDAAWSGLRVQREGTETTLDVSLATVAERLAFLRSVHLKDEDDGGARAASSPGLVQVDDAEAEVSWWYQAPASAAAQAGWQEGDRLRRVGEIEVGTFAAAQGVIRTLPAGKPVEVDVEGVDGARRTLSIEAQPGTLVGQLPIELVPALESPPGKPFGAAAAAGARRTWLEVVNTFRTIGAFFTGRVSFAKNVGGPIMIVKASSDFADRGFLQLLWFLAYVSVMLAVLNILPIPVLDGGHLLFILIEKIKGSPLKDSTMFNLQKVGMMLLLVLMVFAFWNDIQRIILRS